LILNSLARFLTFPFPAILPELPLEPSEQKHLTAAEGFLALGMYDDANAALEAIDPFCRRLPEVLAVRLGIIRQCNDGRPPL